MKIIFFSNHLNKFDVNKVAHTGKDAARLLTFTETPDGKQSDWRELGSATQNRS
jgi:hypothetical protein